MVRRAGQSAKQHPAGPVFRNPVTDEWAMLLEASPARVVAEVIALRGGGVRAGHRHPYQTESFVVFAGELTVVLDDQTQVHGPGAWVSIPRGRPIAGRAPARSCSMPG